MSPELIIILVIVGLIVIYVISVYNSLITLKNRVDNAWAQIDTQLQRRFDLIPNLVETVKGYAKHEESVFAKVTEARAGMANAKTVAEKAEADNQMTGTLKTLFAVAEAYPELKANENFLSLQEELKGTEDKVAFSRQFYNDSVTNFNTQIELFPKNIIAGMLNFTAREYFEVENSEVKKAVKVQF